VSTPGTGNAVRGQMLAFSERLAAGARALGELPWELRAGATPSETVLARGGTRLLRFRGAAPPAAGPPLLIVYAMVNRPYMLDLEPERSFVRGLLGAGRDVYLLDWGAPGPGDAALGLDDYVLDRLDTCLRHLAGEAGGAVDLLGVCQGGTLALCYAALEPAHVRRLALLVTPVDFAAEEFLLARWMRHVDVARMVQRLGNVPGSLLNGAFLALRPLSLSGRKSLDLLDAMQDPRSLATFARMEQWLNDSPDQAGRAFLEFAQTFVIDNALARGGARIGPRPVELAAVRAPVLNLYAARDHIVPPASSRALAALLPAARYREQVFDGGHIGVFASRAAQSVVPRTVAGWLAADIA